MLEFLEIKGFQPYKDVRIDFSKSVNCIVGTGSAGKTSVFRALNWVARNRPLKEGIINDGCDEACVTLGLLEENGDRTEITRRKNRKKVNTYILKTEDGEVQEFTAFGQNPPQEVLDAIRFSDLNIQWQESPYFIVYDSAGQVAQQIRRISGLEEIDLVISRLDSDIRSKNSEVGRIEESLEEAGEGIELLESMGLEDLENDVNRLDSLKHELSAIDSKTRTLRDTIAQHDQVERSLSKLFDPETDIQEIETVSSTYKTFDGKVQELTKIIESLPQRELPISQEEIGEMLSDILHMDKEAEATGSGIGTLSKTLKSLESLQENIERGKTDLTEVGESVKSLYLEIETCPSCGLKLDDESRERLVGG